MKVMVARKAGACFGVQRALDMAQHALEEYGTSCTLGPLIHNPQVVEWLAEQGIHSIDSPSQAEGAASVIIRSHGAAPAVRREISQLGVPLVNATCPHVMRAQNAASNLAAEGRRLLVVGEKGHPEVEAICAYALEAGSAACVVLEPSELALAPGERVGIIAQTTQTAARFEAICAAARAAGADVSAVNTICSATTERQTAAAELAEQVDVMVVVGGRISANTTRLAEICALSCPSTYHVESADELEESWFASCETAGVTAGASTPEYQIREVIAAIDAFAERA